MAAALLAVPTVLTLPADGRPDLALKPRLLGEHFNLDASATDGFTSTETCKEECYTYAGVWTEKCQWNDRVHCDGCVECENPTASDTQQQ